MPLLEIVSEPDIASAEEAVAYLKTLHTLVQQLDICTGNMQEGAFRCDVNISVRPKHQKEFGTRTETKNLNSFRFIERTINYEIERQTNILKMAARSYNKHSYLMSQKMKHAPCVQKKKPPTIDISPNRICYL